LGLMERRKISPQEAFQLKDEAGWESAKQEAVAEGEARGKAEGLRAGVWDVCEVLGLVPTATQRAQVEAMNAEQLQVFREQLKQTRRWPE